MAESTKYTKGEQDALDHLAHMARFGWAALTGRSVRRRDVLKLVSRGLAQSAGEVQVVDGDGFPVTPERYREGWELTGPGRAEVERLRDAQRRSDGYLA